MGIREQAMVLWKHYQEKVLHRPRPTEIRFRFAKCIFHLLLEFIHVCLYYLSYLSLPKKPFYQLLSDKQHGTEGLKANRTKHATLRSNPTLWPTPRIASYLPSLPSLHPSSSFVSSVFLLVFITSSPSARLPVLMPFLRVHLGHHFRTLAASSARLPGSDLIAENMSLFTLEI